MNQDVTDAGQPAGSEPVLHVDRDGVHYTLLGTAHVSRASAEEVQRLAESGDYDAIAVELCSSRHASLTRDDAWRNINLFDILKQRKAGILLANLALSGYQQRIAEQFGIEPGAEMKAAIRAAEAAELPLQLIDRDVGTTLARVYANVGFWGRLQLISGLVASAFSGEEVSEEEIERLKQGDMLDATFTEFAEGSPALYKPLIDERDQFMAARLRQENGTGSDSAGQKVLAVVGAGHLSGIEDYLERSDRDPDAVQEELNRKPPPKKWLRALPWVIVALVLTGFAIGFSRSPELGWSLVKTWVLYNGTLAALGALIARAHPLTILSAFVAAPLTSLNPTVGAGMVTGLMEAWLRKPMVRDFESLRHDVTSLSGWYGNRATRVLLVFFLSNIGSMIGTYAAGAKIFGSLI